MTIDHLDTEYIYGRAEALCNLWGNDPNDDSAWDEALSHARQEELDGLDRD